MQFDPKAEKEHSFQKAVRAFLGNEKRHNADTPYDMDALYETLFDEIMHSP